MISREEADQLFDQLDLDGNGVLNFIEAKAGAKKLKAAGMATAVKTFWSVADADGDKQLTKDEFFNAMASALADPEALSAMLEAARDEAEEGAGLSAAAASEARVAEGTLLFELLDLNRDGTLTRMEIARGLKTLVRAGVPARVSAQDFFKAADENGDAKVDLQEFLAVLAELPTPKAGGGARRPKKRFVPQFELVEAGGGPRVALAAAVPPRASSVAVVGMCNPLLDISAVVPPSVLEKYGVKAGDAVLAEEKHQPVYAELVKSYEVQYIAGGAGQNSVRVCQWMLGDAKPNATAYFGAVGKDAYAAQMAAQAKKDGVNVQYMEVPSEPTGTCAVLVTPDGERSLIANLAAANHFKAAHLEAPSSQAVIRAAQVFYVTGFFLTVDNDAIAALGKHCVEQQKVLCMNLSAPFLIQFFGDQMAAALPFVDVMFGNEAEAAAFGEKRGWGSDVQVIAENLAALPKASGFRCRTVVITQGSAETVVVQGGKVATFPVEPLVAEALVDTNGAGDAFVGGYLAMLAKGAPVAKCVDAGHWAARVVIQRSGCSFPDKCDYE